MQTEFCKQLGIEVPIFAFTHCRDVVVAVSKAGGIGVLGAVGFSAARLKEELDWIDEHIGDHIYGVDTAIPQKYEGMDKTSPEELVAMLQAAIPQQHRDFANKLLADAGVPEWPDKDDEVTLSFSAVQAQVLVDEALTRPKCRMIVNALGTPPADIVKQVHDSGRLIGALAGRLKHGITHKEAGLDFVVCQGSEGGGHAGEVTSMILWPQMVDAVAPLPVLAAGGIGNGRQMLAAMGMGAAGSMDGIDVAEFGGGSCRARPARVLHESDLRGHRAHSLLHRQDRPRTEERVDRGLGASREPQAPAHAIAGLPDLRCGAAHAPLRRQRGLPEGGVQPDWPGGGTDQFSRVLSRYHLPVVKRVQRGAGSHQRHHATGVAYTG